MIPGSTYHFKTVCRRACRQPCCWVLNARWCCLFFQLCFLCFFHWQTELINWASNFDTKLSNFTKLNSTTHATNSDKTLRQGAHDLGFSKKRHRRHRLPFHSRRHSITSFAGTLSFGSIRRKRFLWVTISWVVGELNVSDIQRQSDLQECENTRTAQQSFSRSRLSQKPSTEAFSKAIT